MQTPLFFIKIKKSTQSLFLKYYLVLFLCIIGSTHSNKQKEILKERVRVIKDTSHDDLFATFKKMGITSGSNFVETKTTVTTSYVTVKHASDGNTVDNFLNAGQEDLPKLLLENLGRTKVKYNVMTRKVKKGKYNNFVLAPSNREDSVQEDLIKREVQMKILNFFGKEIFENERNAKQKRNQSFSGSRKEGKLEEIFSKKSARKNSLRSGSSHSKETIQVDSNPNKSKISRGEAMKAAFLDMLTKENKPTTENQKVIFRILVIL